MDSLKIYVMTHKETEVLSDDIHTPLLLGACNHTDNYGYLCDDVGENISDKNSSYCELTGLYWMWKNSDADYIGLAHYRRYFINGFAGDYLSKKDVFNYLEDYDILVPIKAKYNSHSVKDEFINSFISETDFSIVRGIISNDYPDYLESFDEFFNGHDMICTSMFVCNKKLIDGYCEWIFDILSKLESQIDLSEYEGNRARIFGYYGELLFNVWIMNNNLKAKYLYQKHIDMHDYAMRVFQTFPRLRGIASFIISKFK